MKEDTRYRKKNLIGHNAASLCLFSYLSATGKLHGCLFEDIMEMAEQKTLTFSGMSHIFWEYKKGYFASECTAEVLALLYLEKMSDAQLINLVIEVRELDVSNAKQLGSVITEMAMAESGLLKEHYTPSCLTQLIAGMLRCHFKSVESISDPTCGPGLLLFGVNRVCPAERIYARDINAHSLYLAKIIAVANGIDLERIRFECGDTLESKNNDSYQVQVINPPFSLRNKKMSSNHPLDQGQYADWQFVKYVIAHMGEIAFMILPLGVLYRGGAEEKAREWLLDSGLLDCLILLPRRLFKFTAIPVCCMVLSKKSDPKGFFLIDASKTEVKKRGSSYISTKQLLHIISAYSSRKEEENFSRFIQRDEIKENLYIRLSDLAVRENEIDEERINQEIRKNINILDYLENRIQEKRKERSEK